jgi:hypothetical protein
MDVARALGDKLRIDRIVYFTGVGNFQIVNDGVLFIKKASGAATQVTLPKKPVASDFQFIGDAKGDAASNNITIVPDGVTATTINGAANYVINVNYGFVIAAFNGVEWNIVGGQSVTGSIARSQLAQENAVIFNVPLTAMRKVAVLSAILPATDDGTSLGLVNGTYLTSNPSLQTADLKTLTTTRTARFLFTVPPDYVAGQAISCKINAGMVTTVADTTATVNINCARQAAPTVDIGTTTGATTINSLTAADVTFTITPTSVVVGDILDIVITVAVHDAASGTAVIGKINKVSMLLSIKG